MSKDILQKISNYEKMTNQLISTANETIDLTKLKELSYSFIMRELNKVTSRENVLEFCKIYKKNFDNALIEDLNDPEKIAMQNTLVELSKKFTIKIPKELTKNAAISELGNAALVGKYLSDIIKFILNRVPEDRKIPYLNKVKTKINHLNENDLSNKEMPISASMGQAITFVKHVLFNQEPQYIRAVLNEVVSNL